MSAERKRQSGDNGAGLRQAALLARLSSAPNALAAERRALALDVEARLRRLLAEIDEIVLPRRLHVMLGKTEVACLIVGQRRLIDIELSQPQGVADRIAGASGFNRAGSNRAEDDAGSLALRFAARLYGIAALRGPLSLAVSRRHVTPDHAETACPVSALDAALAQIRSQSSFDLLLGCIQPAALAELAWSAEGSRFSHAGAPEWQATLVALATRYRAQGNSRRGPPRIARSQTEGLAVPLPGQRLLVVAHLGDRGFAAVLPLAEGLAAIAACQTASPVSN